MMMRMRTGTSALAWCGLCWAGVGAPASQEAVIETDLPEARTELDVAERNLERVRRARQAGLVSDAWVRGAEMELKLARIESRMLALEKQHPTGKVSDEQYEQDASELEKESAELRVEAARWRVEHLSGLVKAGTVPRKDLDEARNELTLAQLGLALAKLQDRGKQEKTAPVEHDRQYAGISTKLAETARQVALAKLAHTKRMFQAGMVTSVDMKWAALELAEAEDQANSARIEMEGVLGKATWDQVDEKLTELWSAAAARRVERITAIVADAEVAHELGLTEPELVEAFRRDLDDARRELDEARERQEEARKIGREHAK